MKKQFKVSKIWRVTAQFLILMLGAFAGQAAAQVNNMSGLYSSNTSAPITLSGCTDPDDNGDIFIIARTLSITETVPGTFSGTLTMTALTDLGPVSGSFAITNGFAPVANPRTISGMMQSTDPIVTLLNGTFGGTWSKTGTTANITMTLNGTGQTPKGSCNYTGSLPMTSTCSYSISSPQTSFPANGGSGTLNLTAGAGCPWTVFGSNGVTVSPTSGTGSGTLSFSVPNNTGSPRTIVITIAGVTLSIPQAGVTTTQRTPFDFDGDGKADVSVFRPGNGVWYLQQSTAGFNGISFGANGDSITPADFDGDGKTDVAVFRPSNGTWYLNRTQLGFTGFVFGTNGDIPMPADYDGDGKADIAVFRPSNGTWYIQRSTAGFIGVVFGAATDKPVAADYDGDGKADVAVFRPSNGTWYLQQSTAGFTGIVFGANGDLPVAANYDGDSRADLAVFRPSNGTWYLNRSQAGFTGVVFGTNGDMPAAADFDGDGKADVAVFRPSNGTWYLNRSTQGFTGAVFGTNGDKPAPNAFVY